MRTKIFSRGPVMLGPAPAEVNFAQKSCLSLVTGRNIRMRKGF